MAHINLLPWRDERRKQREHEFYRQLAMVFVFSLVIVGAWAFTMGQRVDNQHARNDYLRAQIRQVDHKIAQIKNLKKTRAQLLARKRIIEHLQSSRSQMVHLFDALVKTITDNVRLTSVSQKGQVLVLDGVAQSNASVAGYMRRLGASPWLGQPDLEKTVNHHNGTRMPYSFGLQLTLSKPTEQQIKAAANTAREKRHEQPPSRSDATATAGKHSEASATSARDAGGKARADIAEARG